MSEKSELEDKVRRQVEYYFSDVNLPKDKFLKGKVSDDPNGYVDLSIIISFNRMDQLKVSVEDTAKALESSEILQLSEDRQRVKRSTPLVELGRFEERAVYVSGFSSDASPDIDDVRKVFEAFGKVLSVKLRKNAKGEFNGTAFVEYATHDDVVKALEEKDLRLEGSDVVLVVLTIADFKSKRKSGEIVEDRPPKKKKKKDDGETEGGNQPEKDEREFVKGLVLKFEGIGPGVSREDLREIYGEFGVVAWVDFSRDEADGFIRFAELGSAEKALERLKENRKEIGGKIPEMSVLQGEPEKEFWDNVFQQQENRRKRIDERKRQKRFGPQKRFKKKRKRDRNEENFEEDNDDTADAVHPKKTKFASSDDEEDAREDQGDNEDSKDDPMSSGDPEAASKTGASVNDTQDTVPST
eukprot:CAMPEP_0184740306 /NCGR_PEP_ID=MMETSP0315-20130426/3326_1 /TAXON_ID=101924 /ORGANISM="Rhodosorus marinus, Strain UTEX LB 2760" /LENGTH=411 /DNA_ID=CAMNT_0027209911 /DNA_START=97 /DNA_END=1332 /DNA_ORIENTATION=-